MYPKYFGLKEASFSITPDPQYLFLSEQHREALAHLLYGAGDSGGFVLLTGEVGTGKTTVCRAFLEQLPDGVDVALVLNPAMTAVELMHAICDEFGVEVPDAEPSAKALVDRLNQFLLDAHARGRRPVLIIDEAQNLRPNVMEQIRLLTNLETAKQKLLQIFLIGQPELRAMLASPDLRQLNQRITARFHLRPFNARETAAYVDHRIAVAGVDRPLFTPGALRRVHHLSGGVPRLINLLCDRSLLGAAVSRRLQVTPEIVTRAAREVKGNDVSALPRRGRGLAIAASVLIAAAGGAWIGASGVLDLVPQRLMALLPAADSADADTLPKAAAISAEDSPLEPELEAVTVAEPAADTASEALTEAPSAPPPSPVSSDASPEVAADARQSMEGLSDVVLEEESPTEPVSAAASTEPIPRISMSRVTPELSEADADQLDAMLTPNERTVDELLGLWGVATDAVVSGLDCGAVRAFGLECERGKGRWSDLRLFDRPAALALSEPNGGVGYAVIGAVDEEHAVLHHGGQAHRVPISMLDERWSGDYLMLWRRPPFATNVIGKGSSQEAIAWLRGRLASLPGINLAAEPARYDSALTEAVRGFQTAHGLVPDGVAGPRTLILLNNALTTGDVPRLTQSP